MNTKPPLNETQLPRVRALFEVMHKLPSGRQDFARSLQDNFRQWGKLSPAQMEWAEKLIALAAAPKAVAEGQRNVQSSTVPIPGFAVVEKLLFHAARHITWPAIRLETRKGQRIKLSPRRSSKMVRVRVGEYTGDVSGEVLDTSYLRFLTDLPDVLETLREMAAHPVETAILYGKKTGNCCFCGLGLTDKRSVSVGYGPICADNYRLPWGDAETVQEMDVAELGQLLDQQMTHNNT